jgi:Ulp1 family protease
LASKEHPVCDDTAEKRHNRVKSWTKNINIFDKDFVIIPINEYCHWFLAIICFPGLKGSVPFSENTPNVIPPVTKKNKSVARKHSSISEDCMKSSTH